MADTLILSRNSRRPTIRRITARAATLASGQLNEEFRLFM